MNLDVDRLLGRYVRLERIVPTMRDEIRTVFNTDPSSWRLIVRGNGSGDDFPDYWHQLQTAMTSGERFMFAIYLDGSEEIVGTTGFQDIKYDHRTVEIGGTFIAPYVRGGLVNLETKLLSLGHAFGEGAIRVQFQTDERNVRSRAALAKIGAREEGILRNHAITWTGDRRCSVVLSIIDEEWSDVRPGLEAQLGAHAPARG